MNIGDTVKNSNSWHWLAVVVALSAAASAVVPTYGWKDVLAYRRGTLVPRENDARARLDRLAALDVAEADAAERKAGDVRRRAAQARAEFAAYGFEEVPAGEDSVFAAQGRIVGALARRHIRIVSNEANVTNAAAVAYRAAGDFRDIFMFLVGETHVRANYAFKDISARKNAGGDMDLSFQLQVHHK